MADQLNKTIEEFNNLDKTKIIRPDLGKVSLKDFENKYIELIKILEVIRLYNKTVSSKINQEVNQKLNSLVSQLDSFSKQNDDQYVNNRQNIKNTIVNQIDAIKWYFPYYTSAAIEQSNLLADLDVNQQVNEIKESIQKSADQYLKDINTKADKILEDAKIQAGDIENKARKTAKGTSLQIAQEQFEEAKKHNQKQAIIWGAISFIVIALLIVLIIKFFKIENLPEETVPVIYYTGIRLAILALLGTVSAFTLKIFKAHLHMHQHNLHRKRIANSMEAFVESANSQDQRDIILSHLVDSIVSFGNSGIISKDDDSSQSSKMTIDNITRSLTSNQ